MISQPKEPKKPKIETTKTDLDTEDSRMDLPLLDGDTFEASRAKLAALDKADKERVEKETALNELQSFNFDLGDKIYQEDHEAASTEAERETIQAEVSKVSDWLDEEAGVETPLEEFTSRLKVLRDMAAPIFARVREHRERPEWLENLKQSLNHSSSQHQGRKLRRWQRRKSCSRRRSLSSLRKKLQRWRNGGTKSWLSRLTHLSQRCPSLQFP